MTAVRFATLCDNCGRRSEEYSSWPTCRECFADTCSDCDICDKRTEDERNLTLCGECYSTMEEA